MPLLAISPLGFRRTCDHECMIQGNIAHDSLLAPKLGGWHVLGWVDFCVHLQRNSNSLARQGIGASCTPKMFPFECSC